MSDRPFTQRLFDWAGVPPVWIGLLLFAAQLTACWAWSAVFGVPEAGVTKGREVLGPVNVIFALLIVRVAIRFP